MTVKKNKTLSLSNYCSLYIDKFNAHQLSRSWQHKAAMAAATATVATGMFLGSASVSIAQVECTPAYEQVASGLPVTNPGAITQNGGYARTHLVDYDGDGDFDLMVGEKLGRELAYYQNTGTATAPIWSAAVNNPNGLNLPAGINGTAPAFVDIDGDGDLDAFLGTLENGLAFFRNTGTRTAPVYAAAQLNPFGINIGINTPGLGNRFGYYVVPTFADIDNDGDLDLVVGELRGNQLFFRNTGTRTAPAFAASQINPFGLVDIGWSSAPSFVDLDNDGDFDLMIGEDNGTFNYFRNTGTRTAPVYAAPQANPFKLTATRYAAPTFSDLNSDGDLDLFVGNDVGNTILFTNSGTAQQADYFLSPYNFPSATGIYASPTLVDIDADGDLDALLGSGNGTVLFARNIAPAGGTPNFAAPTVLLRLPRPAAQFANTGQADPTFADLDGDGDYDMLAGGDKGAYYYFRNEGTATTPNFVFQSINPFGITSPGNTSTFTPTRPTFADIDNDGDMDLFTGDKTTNQVSYFKNIGTAQSPNFAAPVNNPFGITTTEPYNRLTFGDINNDGDLDLFIGTKDEISFYENTGTPTNPTFSAPLLNPFGVLTNNPNSTPYLADITNDGVLDLFVGERTTGFTRIYKNNTLAPTISLSNTGTFSACGTELVKASVGVYPANELSVKWYNAITRREVATGLEFNPEVLGVRASYYAVVSSASGCNQTSTVGNYVPVVPPSTFDLSGQAGYNSATLSWVRNGECDAPVREYEVYADPSGFGTYFLLGFSTTPTYESVGLLNGEKITFKIRPIYMNGTYGLYSNTVTLRPSIVLGEEDNEKAGFAFFPNPNNGEFNLRLQDGSASASVSVTNLSGQRVYTTTLNATQTSINLGNIASGMYIVRVETAQGTYQQKVSVVR